MFQSTSLSLTAFLSVLTLAPQTFAATIESVPILQQLEQVVTWFTGEFSNYPQFNNDNTVPLITMSNCSVDIIGGSFGSNTKSIFLEQNFLTTPQPPRLRHYGFSPGTEGINLTINSFESSTNLQGLCHQPVSERSLLLSNINPEQCNLELFRLLEPVRYSGTNSPDGCPAASNPIITVISTLSIQENRIESLDLGFVGETQIFGTPITFTSVTESNLIPGLMALFFMGIGVSIKKQFSS
ncbi:MAG: CpcT/CpeT family chromophore lyase [Crocosphaera sp.]